MNLQEAAVVQPALKRQHQHHDGFQQPLTATAVENNKRNLAAADLQQLATAAGPDYNMENLEKDSNHRDAVAAKPMGQQQLTKAIHNGPSAAEWARLIMPLK